jgi:hypothetical protein
VKQALEGMAVEEVVTEVEVLEDNQVVNMVVEVDKLLEEEVTEDRLGSVVLTEDRPVLSV